MAGTGKRQQTIDDLRALHLELKAASTEEEKADISYFIELQTDYLVSVHGMTPYQITQAVQPQRTKPERQSSLTF